MYKKLLNSDKNIYYFYNTIIILSFIGVLIFPFMMPTLQQHAIFDTSHKVENATGIMSPTDGVATDIKDFVVKGFNIFSVDYRNVMTPVFLIILILNIIVRPFLYFVKFKDYKRTYIIDGLTLAGSLGVFYVIVLIIWIFF